MTALIQGPTMNWPDQSTRSVVFLSRGGIVVTSWVEDYCRISPNRDNSGNISAEGKAIKSCGSSRLSARVAQLAVGSSDFDLLLLGELEYDRIKVREAGRRLICHHEANRLH